ncbi:S41 family peptidase [Pontibacter akesuensis]|uniref:Peptidase family S41 n=1 Tax=Pontibacter akesuensis TaxID=388950 RepID=A0A1I7KLY3_9BACT|nr:S41 family peptidase [Pontibacter akesuensis]GHA77707.1 hypothetical protein GCM10007389_34370 [Pontibacter akesuensis]SFU98467.1 Peptidase family S41 [Pontibacter akesuensis]
MKRRLYVSIWLFLLTVLSSSAQHTDPMFSGAAVKADLDYLYRTLQAAHYNLYAYVSKKQYNGAYTKIRTSIRKDSLSLLETSMLFQKLAAVGNTGHSEIDFPAPSYITFARNGGTVFPLEVAFEDELAYVRKSYASHPAIKAGDQVLSINKVPIGKIIGQIHPYISAERPYYKNVKLEFWSFPRYCWAVFGEKKAFSVSVKGADGKVATHTIDAIPVMDSESQRNGEIVKNDRFYKFYGDVAYLHPGSFSSAAADGEATFKAFVDSAFTDIKSKHAKQLVIDLRNNAGGHNAFSDYLIAYFADEPFRWYSKFSIKTSAALKEQTRKQPSNSPLDAYSKAILDHPDGEAFAYDLPIQHPMPEDKRFTGKVYVLVNRHTYSMAAVSAALIQDYGFGEIIGEETGDVPTLYGSVFSFALPQTGIAVKVPKSYIVRPNGDEKLTGVIPDHKVRDHLLDEEDEILSYTLKKLQQ